MAPTLKIQSGGVWRTVADGKLKVRVGSAWVTPSTMKVQVAGVWRDTGYAGSPAAPTSLAVNAWATHDAVSFKWVAGVGGAAVSLYEVAVNNEANTTRVATKTDTTSPSADFTEVVQNTKYNVYVRAKSAAGLYSAWTGPLQIKMGKDAFTTYTTETGTRAYSLSKDVVGYKDAAVGPVIPTAVLVQTIRYQITNTFSGVLSPYGSHSISRWGNTVEREQFNWPSASIDQTVNVTDYQSNGGVQGMICRGTGWSTAPSGSFVCTGTITVNGQETYTYEQAHVTPAVANGYW
jgi:hypothetical protein